MMRVIVLTNEGTASIEANAPWSESTDLQVKGTGAETARTWLETAYGAFGHFVGQHAAPMDLHHAALQLQENPRPEIQVLGFKGDIAPYDADIPEDCTT